MRTHSRRYAARLAAAAFFALAFAARCPAGDGEDAWQVLCIVRFGDIDAIDSEDGPLADFLKGVRNDGRFPPPFRSLIGPELKNPTLFGIPQETWMEGALLAPAIPGPAAMVWIFPVEGRDEYIDQLAHAGLSEYEGMDGVSVLRELDADGNAREWHLEWLPGNVAVFGASRQAVAAARGFYAEQNAARGALAGMRGEFVEPDVAIRVIPQNIVAWQDGSPGVYWWRNRIGKAADDLIRLWQPYPARARLVNSLADELATWTRTVRRLDFGFWFEPSGVEWRMDAEGSFGAPPGRSQLDVMRCFPAETAIAYALNVTPAYFAGWSEYTGRLLLSAAGGVVTAEARQIASGFARLLSGAGLRQCGAAWVAPPRDRPALGGARLVVTEWERPEMLDAAWQTLLDALKVDSPVYQAFSQIGWEVRIDRLSGDSGLYGVRIAPARGDAASVPYLDAAYAVRKSGGRMAIVGGETRIDTDDRAGVLAYRAAVAERALDPGLEGGPDIREAFTRMEARGAGIMGIFDPVRFAQMAFVDAADWRRRAPDESEPASAHMAREMLEYDSGGAWNATGDGNRESWSFRGGVSWRSLTRLCAALGITEAIGMH